MRLMTSNLLKMVWLMVWFCCMLVLFPDAADSTKHDGLQMKKRGVGESPNVFVNQRLWLPGGEIWFMVNGKRCTVSNNLLRLVNTMDDEGSDDLGKFVTATETYQSYHGPMFQAIVKTYQNIPVTLVGQVYLNDTRGTSTGSDKHSSSGFPTFKVDPSPDMDLGVYVAAGYHSGYVSATFSRFNSNMTFPNGFAAGPMALYNHEGEVVIVSPFSSFMSSSIWYNKNNTLLSYGLLGRALSVPAGHSTWTILYHNTHGVNQAFTGWGAVMQKYYHSQNQKYAAGDIFLNYLGYWTDRGAFYYYNTEVNKTYEATLLDVWQTSLNENIPYRFMQYDSWFYEKAHNNSVNGGALRWEPVPEYFPHGPSYIVNVTQLVAGTHLKWWSPETPLSKQRGGDYDFWIEHKMALPDDPQFYIDVLKGSKKWGNKLLLQDWLAQMQDHLNILQTDVTIGERFMYNIGRGAKLNDLTIETCTTYPRHNLASLTMDTVTFTRVSDDYQPSNDNWKIGVSSLWVWSLGQTPFKDVFLTSSNQTITEISERPEDKVPEDNVLRFKKGEKVKPKVEHYPILESVVASLSGGPVAPGDQIGKTNRTLLMRCCNSDGLLLKPDKPATAIDGLFYARSFNPSHITGEVYSTYSNSSELFFGIIFAADMSKEFLAMPADFAFHGSYIYDYTLSAPPRFFSRDDPLMLENCTKSNFCLYYTTPLIRLKERIIYLIGEADKWIPHSKQRIHDMTLTSTDVKVTLSGAVSEVVHYTIYDTDRGAYVSFNCTIGQNGQTMLSVGKGECEN